eukprot:TRINITY_DN3976_c1_g1_i1.p1 TRINITY_DN3976_c1_g1~~TRINITY_DN3976_c1_g1_i1.p1  ORF type:complete len:140 (+),score=28.21 TRINITY_DN3976_c1_g1_i1:61-420(+)
MMPKVCTKPFIPELEFAVAVYQPILPFLITPPGLPNISNFKKYSIEAAYLPQMTIMPLFALGLFFTPVELFPNFFGKVIVLEQPDSYLTSIVDWNSNTSTVTFWFNSTLMDHLKQKGGI